MARATSPALMPATTLRLVGRYWAPLLFWYAVGQLAHDLTLRAAARIGSRGQAAALLSTEYSFWRVVGLVVMSFGVLLALGTVILMLHSVERALPGVQAALGSRPGREPAPDSPVGAGPVPHPRRPVETLAETLLPFVVFYGAWGLFTADAREYGVIGINTAGNVSLLDIPVNWLSLGVALAALGLRVWCERALRRTGNRVLGLATPVFEAVWIFFAVLTVGVVLGEVAGWFTSRAVWAATGEALGGLVDAVLPFSGGEPLRWLASLGADVKDGLLLPLLWLTIAAIVYGADMERARRALEPTRLQRVHRLSGAWSRVPGRLRGLLELVSRDLREKWTPAANGLRLALRAGPRFYLTFCLCYVALEVLVRWGWMGATQLAGPHPWAWWAVALVPLDFARDAVHEVGRICLLAAAFDLALRRAGPIPSRLVPAGPSDPVTGRSAGTAPDPATASGPPPATS